MRKLVLSLFAVAFMAATAAAGEFNKVVSVGDKAPVFSGIPASTPDGQDASLTLGDIKEDVVVVIFLANHCPVVLNTEDRINDVVQAYEGKSVKLVGLCVETNRASVDDLNAIKARAKKDKKYSYVYGYDETQDIGKKYGATNTPQVFVLDRDRVIRYMGLIDDNHNNESKVTKTYLKDAVDSLLAGKEIAVKETKPMGCGISYGR
jgi:thiol-disulfide isomerase/thioredoxin